MESKSRYIALCFYIPKKDGSLWLVQDYRKLNQVTIKDKTPLPLIGEVINKLKKAKYFNKLNLIWEYKNIQIKERDEWKAAFLMNKGVIICVRTNIFLFLLSIFLNFIFLFF